MGAGLVQEVAVEHEDLFAEVVSVRREARPRCISDDGRGARHLTPVAVEHLALHSRRRRVDPFEGVGVDRDALAEVGKNLHGPIMPRRQTRVRHGFRENRV